MVVFFLTVLSIWALVLLHLFFRLGTLVGACGLKKVLLGLLVAFGGLSYIPARIWLGHSSEWGFEGTITWLSTVLIGVVTVLWTLVVGLEVVSLAKRLCSGVSLFGAHLRLRRRVAAGVLAATFVLSIVGMIKAHSAPEVAHLQLTVPGGDSRRLIAFSDAHLGDTASPGQWRSTLSVIEQLKPDGILIPGDLLDDAGPASIEQLAELRERLPEVPVLVTSGNHDFYSGQEAFKALCARFGFRLCVLQSKLTTIPIDVVQEFRGKLSGDSDVKLSIFGVGSGTMDRKSGTVDNIAGMIKEMAESE